MSKIKIDFLYFNDLGTLLEDIGKYANIKILRNRYVYGKVWDQGSLAKIKKIIESTYNLSINTLSTEIGPHISIQYENEKPTNHILQYSYHSFFFTPEKIARVSIIGRVFYVITIVSRDIERQRLARGLPSSPIYKNIRVPFHITIGEETPTQKK